MKAIIRGFFLAVAIYIFTFVIPAVLSSYPKNERLITNSEIENAVVAVDESPLQEAIISEFEDAPDEIIELSIEDENVINYKITTLIIHEDLPEFTFTYIVSIDPTAKVQSGGRTMQPVQINIKIEDSDGNIIQSISSISRSERFLDRGLSFADYNFDGYLDMRLEGWQDGAAWVLSDDFYWLWDKETAQFVLNERLIEIGQGSRISTNQETRQIVVSNENNRSDILMYFYKYLDGDFIEMEYRDSIEYTTTLRIHEDLPEFTFTRIVSNDTTIEAASGYFDLEPIRVDIKIEDGDGNIIQSISDISQNRTFIRENLTFDDYNFDGYLDMRLRRWQDGAGALLADDYFWLWDKDSTQFVLNGQLMDIGQAVSLRADQETRRISIVHRGRGIDIGGSDPIILYYEYLNGEFVKVD